MLKNAPLKILLLPVFLMVADLIIKAWLVNNLPNGESINIAGEAITIQRITTHRMALRINAWSHIIDYVHLAFQVAFVVFFMKALRANVHNSFKLASALIVAGWIGLYLDRFLFSAPGSGALYLDYVIVANSFVTSLTSLMIMVGWILLLLSVVIQFKEVKIIFKSS
jgi:lipoprotein signal peptidase